MATLVSHGDYNSLDDPNDAIIENNTNTMNKIMNTLAKVNPFYAYLASKFMGKITDLVIPNTNDYKKVSTIYNGQGLYEKTMELKAVGFSFENGLSKASNYEFSLIDKVGIRQVWKNPEYNNYVVIPPIWGVYTGINSPNNSLCLTGTLNGKTVESF